MTFGKFMSRRFGTLIVDIFSSLIITLLIWFFAGVIFGNEINFLELWKWVYIIDYAIDFLRDLMKLLGGDSNRYSYRSRTNGYDYLDTWGR